MDEVKIDRSFVSSVDHDTNDLLITRSIIDLGANLSLEVIAEGVEDQATWDRLAALGCHGVQGEHLAPPLPAEALLIWLRGYTLSRHHRAQAPRRRRRGAAQAP